MKTKNNVQKAINKSLAIIASLVLISFTVNAQSFWRSILHSETVNEIAVAMVDGNYTLKAVAKSEAKDLSAYAAYLVEEKEEPLRLEDWMNDDRTFDVSTVKNESELTNELLFNKAVLATTPEVDEKLDLEDWMLDESNFDVKVQPVKKNYIATSTFVFQDINDQKLQLEDWMVSRKFWK